MHIQNITVDTLQTSFDGKRLQGQVHFDIAPTPDAAARTLKIDCDVAFSNKIRPDAIIVGEAVRQLRRLPELRMGEERLTFEPGMKPLAASNPEVSMDKQVSNR